MNASSLECVYYPQPYPHSERVLTLLALVFDKIHFPGVWLPKHEVDERAIWKEIRRIQSYYAHRNRISNDSILLLGLMAFVKKSQVLNSICIFTGRPGYPGILEEGTNELMMALEEMIYGPPPSGFTPTPSLGIAKGLPGRQSADNSVNSPAWIAYPANTVIYASKHGLPLVSDCLELPIPCVPGNVKDNAKALSTYLALEAVKLTFPKLRGVTAEEILQIRDTLRDDLRPFRIKMLELSSQLNTAISSAASASDIQRQAKFIADTRVLPELERVRRAVADTGRPWYNRLIDLTLDAPELAGNFFTMPPQIAIAKVFARIGKELVEIRDEYDQKRKILNGSGLGYLIKLEEMERG